MLIKIKHAWANQMAGSGYDTVQKDGQMFLKGSSGINDATQSKEVLASRYQDNPNLDPYICTGQNNGFVALKITQTEQISGVESIKKVCTDWDSKSLLQSVKFSGGGKYFYCFFKSDGAMRSRMALLDGVDLFGEYDCVPLASVEYKEGRTMIVHEAIASDDPFPEEGKDYFESLPELPDALKLLTSEYTCVDQVEEGIANLEAEKQKCVDGFQGEDNRSEFIKTAIRLRSFGESRQHIEAYVMMGVDKTYPPISKAWAKATVNQIFYQYRQVKRSNGDTAKRGAQALMDALS